METLILPASQPHVYQRALQVLHEGSLVVFPTDTVYGLGALPTRMESISQLFTVKGREAAKAIPILISDLEELAQVAAEVSPVARRLAERFWPGPLTLVVPRHPSLPDILSPLPTIGVRMPDHPVALALLRESGPLAVTSANLSGQPSASTAQEVFQQLSGRVPLIIDGGRTPGGVASTVVDCTASQLAILRPGPLSLDELREAMT